MSRQAQRVARSLFQEDVYLIGTPETHGTADAVQENDRMTRRVWRIEGYRNKLMAINVKRVNSRHNPRLLWLYSISEAVQRIRIHVAQSRNVLQRQRLRDKARLSASYIIPTFGVYGKCPFGGLCLPLPWG